MIIPDIQGEWSMSISAGKGGISDKYIIPINRHFSPTSRLPEEFEVGQIPMDNFQLRHWDIPDDSEEVWEKFQGARTKTLREVTVKRRRINNFAWNGFTDEKNAQIHSTIYYDCEKEVEDYLDRGEEPPTLVDWLSSKNKMFSGNSPSDKALWAAVPGARYFTKEDSVFDPGMIIDVGDLTYFDWKYDGNYSSYDVAAPSYWIPVWRDGLEINGRPVVWMVNNLFCTITNLQLRSNITSKFPRTAPPMVRHTRPTVDMPILLEDTKSLYIAEGQNLAYSITKSTDIQTTNPYVVYCYVKQDYGERKVKGIRYTSYQGFEPVEVFQTEDYGQMPPMNDFRRTLYWNPNLWTDENGKAHVEFWNNSTCTDMIISAEGITEDGKFVVGK
jgi:hypothetical protein